MTTTTTTGTMRAMRSLASSLRVRRWSQLTQVERVDVYTRQSLYWLLWGMEGFVLYAAVSRMGDQPVLAAALVVAAVVLCAVATRTMSRVVALHPDSWRIPWGVAWPLVPLLLAGALALTQVEIEVRFAGALLLISPVVWALGGVRGRAEQIGLLVAVALVPGLVVGVWWAAAYGVGVGLFFSFTVRASLWLLDVVAQLDATRTTQARLAVAEERLRFSRDVHDVMGRHLSTIAVQSELASRLVGRDDDRAAEQMLEVRGLAHDALREARELARGYRTIALDQELEGARSLLGSAGIEVEVDVAHVPEQWHEAAGWVIREGVTNVLRHSAATAVSITYAEDELAVSNDAPAPESGATGSGLVGLGERLVPLGASVRTERESDRFALVARLPAPAAGVAP